MLSSKRALEFLRSIDFERSAGGPGERRAMDAILTAVQEAGYKPTVETFEVFSIEKGDGWVEFGGRRYPARPFSLTEPFDVEGELVFVESARFVRKHDVNGKILMSYLPVLPNDYMKLVDYGVKGLVRISGAMRGISTGHLPYKAVQMGKVIPAVSISYETGYKLLRSTAKRIRIHGEYKRVKAEGHNIIAVYGEGEREILVTAHYDTVANSHGAADNGGGTAVLVELARTFAENSPSLERRVRFIWFSGEELGLVGSYDYTDRHATELSKIDFQINIDVVGDTFGQNRAVIIGNAELRRFVGRVAKDLKIPISAVQNIYSSDCIPFGLKDIPSINLARGSGLPSFLGHSEGDSVDWVTERGLEPILKLAFEVIMRLASDEELPVKRTIPPKIRRKVIEYCRKRSLRCV